MNNPAAGVPQNLLPHVHLISTYRWPTLMQLGLDTTVEYLLQAPKITREVSSMVWTFLNAPPDGTVMLVWQPPSLQTRFASDGYVWGDVEKKYVQEYRGYNVEMYSHRCGYLPPNEQYTVHARRRYRLLPSQTNPNPNLPPCDPSLWIVHYARGEPQDALPINRIPITPQSAQLMQQRRYWQQQGQLVRKEFMLHDQSNWPSINMPAEPMTPVYPGNMPPHYVQIRQQPYQHVLNRVDMGPSPAKRVRQAGPQRPGPNKATGAALPHDTVLEEEEGVDLLDLLSPRDISQVRYMQHHEWMEEVFASPYATSNIMPLSLGLGRKGELEPLTRGFFEPPRPTTPPGQKSDRSRSDYDRELSKKMEPGKAEEFIKHAENKISQLNAEMERLKLRHARRMEKLAKGTSIREAEKSLRNAVTSMEDAQPNPRMSSSQSYDPANGDVAIAALRQQDRLGEIVKNLTSIVGKHIETLQDYKCIDKGGLEEKAVPSTTADDVAMADSALEANDIPSFDDFTDIPDLPPDEPGMDVAMPNVSEVHHQIPVTQDPLTQPTNPLGLQAETGDWVMVDRNPQPTHPHPAVTVPPDANGSTNQSSSIPGLASSALPPQPASTATESSHLSTTVAAADSLVDFGPDANAAEDTNIGDVGDLDVGDEHFDTGAFDDAIDFGGLDTAGEELAGFEAAQDNGGLEGGFGGGGGGGMEQRGGA